ncbi:damage-inducible protein DinB [Bacillus sp. ISL-32]|nr:damage-inducible protein DinB [Bacillus sp. ISL-32]
MNNIEQLYQYHTWANKRIFEHIKSLPADIANQETKSVFSSINEVLFHMCQTDHIWLRTLLGDSFQDAIDGLSQFKGIQGQLGAIENQFLALNGQYNDFFTRQKNLDQPFSIYHEHYGTLDTTYAEIMQHIVNHGTYHRGNITAMLRQLGHTGIATDYIQYLYDSKQ